MKTGILVKSKLPQHNELTTWRVIETTVGLSGKEKVYCEAAHDTKSSRGFDTIGHEFNLSEIEEI